MYILIIVHIQNIESRMEEVMSDLLDHLIQSFINIFILQVVKIILTCRKILDCRSLSNTI